jgi:hypothetical protein
MYVSSVSSAFRHMLQVLSLDVSKVDKVLHLPRFLLPCSVSPPPSAEWALPYSPLLNAGDVQNYVGARNDVKMRALGRLYYKTYRLYPKRKENRGILILVCLYVGSY